MKFARRRTPARAGPAGGPELPTRGAASAGHPRGSRFRIKACGDEPFPAGRNAVADRYRTLRALALRLLNGEVLEHVDGRGRRWRATAKHLTVVSSETGEGAPVVDGDAYEIADRLTKLP